MSGAERKDRGLSPSSLSLFMGCERKYFLKKKAKVEIDDDSSDDTEAFRVGKAFHKCLEDVKHELEGFTYAHCKKVVVEEHSLSEEFHTPLVMAMLGKYKQMHRRAGLKALACEIAVDTPTFYGFVDVILEDFEGRWWIGDMKTASAYSHMLVPTLTSHPQLSLYAKHADYIGNLLGLDIDRYQGCRYRLTTKSKAKRKVNESLPEYVARLQGSVDSFDFILPKDLMRPDMHLDILISKKEFIDTHHESHQYTPNYSNCQSYFRPCEYWSRCHGGKKFSEDQGVEVIKA